MPDSDLLSPYLQQAEELFAGRLSEANLSRGSRYLPQLNQEILNSLAAASRNASLTHPRRGWAIAAVTDMAAQAAHRSALQPRAAFHLARAANEWVRPARAAKAAARGRAGFELLSEPGWMAACDWQRHALPWTHKNYPETYSILSSALHELEIAGLEEWIPECQLSLAYSCLLQGEYHRSESLILDSELRFAEQGKQLELARCWVFQASRLRRQGHPGEMQLYLEKARQSFLELGATVELAKVEFQMAHYYQMRGDFPQSEQAFRSAQESFAQFDLPLWEGMAWGGLGIVYNNIGETEQALSALEHAQKNYSEFDVIGLRADNLVDIALLEMLRSNYQLSLGLLVEAENHYQSLGVPQMAATAALYQGEACLHLARNQTALHHFERAQNQFLALDTPWRQAECELNFANAWLALGHTELAMSCLEKAAAGFRQENQMAYLAQTLNQRAMLHIKAGDYLQAVSHLEEVMRVSKEYRIDIQAVTARQHLGEAYSLLGRTQEAILQLETAASITEKSNLLVNAVSCLISLGHGYFKASQLDQAQLAWENALALNQEANPEADWQTFGGLARLATLEGNDENALACYRKMNKALGILRLGFWQTGLLDSYLKSKTEIMAEAVIYTANHAVPAEALAFIEEGKAQLVARQLAGVSTPGNRARPELDGLRSEIFLLKNRINQLPALAGRISLLEAGKLRGELVKKIKLYDAELARLERLQPHGQSLPSSGNFDLDFFRQTIQASIPNTPWLALDYYQTSSQIFCMLISNDDCELHSIQITGELSIALGLCKKAHQSGYELREADLALLATKLLPASLHPGLCPDLHLIISPHGDLHAVPWPALILEQAGSAYLVACSIPLIVPSLQSFSILRARQPSGNASPLEGLLVAAFDFNGRHPPLPEVRLETQSLQARLGNSLRVLSGEDAVWDQLVALGQPGGLQRFAFLHLASHAFHDPVTTRLSGFALSDRDIWLENIWDVAPLPKLVTLSACSASRSQVYAGDEQAGLAITCLAAGAQSVVGSLWPVLDLDTPRLMIDFYDALLPAGQTPAYALALAQRNAIGRGEAIALWGSFICLGSGI